MKITPIALSLTFILVLTAVSTACAQDSASVGTTDTTDSAMDMEEGRARQDFFFFDFNWDYLMNLEGASQKWYGRGLSFGGMYDFAFNKNGNISFGAGVGFTSSNYYLNNVVTRFDSLGVSYSEFGAPLDTNGQKLYDRSKLSVNYVDVPLELRFRTNENSRGHRWKLALGAKVGYMVQAHEKVRDNNDKKIKFYDYPNITRLRYGVTARVGYGSAMLSAFYSLTPLFEDGNSSTTINQFSVGISLVPF